MRGNGRGIVCPASSPQRDEHRFHEPDHVLLPYERRFDVDLGEFGLPVEAQIFIAEAARQLEVAIVPRHHEQLLVDLRRLRQGVELARVHARGHEVVARPFGRGLGENRCLDFEEPEIRKCAARPLQQAVAQHQIRLQLGTAQIEVPVLQPQLLGRELFALAPRHGNRRRLGGANDVDRRRVDLHLTRGELRVLHLGRPRDHAAAHHDDRLRAHRLCAGDRVGRRPAGTERHLDDSLAVTQVEEHDPTEVAAAMHPPAESYRLPHVFRA